MTIVNIPRRRVQNANKKSQVSKAWTSRQGVSDLQICPNGRPTESCLEDSSLGYIPESSIQWSHLQPGPRWRGEISFPQLPALDTRKGIGTGIVAFFPPFLLLWWRELLFILKNLISKNRQAQLLNVSLCQFQVTQELSLSILEI